MKLRSRFVSAGLGAAMIVGSMFAMSSPANANPGDLAVSGTITLGAVVNVTATGTGGTVGNQWNGTFSGTGSTGCIQVTRLVANGGDTITWDAADTGTQVLNNTEVIIDTRGCPAPPQQVCRLTLTGNRTLMTAVGGFPEAPTGFRQGTFSPTGPVGNATVSQVAPPLGNNSCAAGAGSLGNQIATAIGCPAPAGIPFTCAGTAAFTASLFKVLEL